MGSHQEGSEVKTEEAEWKAHAEALIPLFKVEKVLNQGQFLFEYWRNDAGIDSFIHSSQCITRKDQIYIKV